MSRSWILWVAALLAAGAVLWPIRWPDRRSGLGQAPQQWPLWRSPSRQRREREAAVHQLVRAFAAELRAGQAPHWALLSAASEGGEPPCPRAVRTAGLGGDVAEALRIDAAMPGAAGLRAVAACWEVSATSGAGLAVSLERLAVSLRASAQAQDELTGELAAVRASVRILAALPLFGLVVGSWAGAAPLTWLLGSPAGVAVLLGGLLLQAAGLLWLQLMVRGVLGRLR